MGIEADRSAGQRAGRNRPPTFPGMAALTNRTGKKVGPLLGNKSPEWRVSICQCRFHTNAWGHPSLLPSQRQVGTVCGGNSEQAPSLSLVFPHRPSSECTRRWICKWPAIRLPHSWTVKTLIRRCLHLSTVAATSSASHIGTPADSKAGIVPSLVL